MDRKPLIGICICAVVLLVGITILPLTEGSTLMKSAHTEDLVVMVETDKTNYRIGEPVEISVYVENHGDTDITLVFPTVQTADYVVHNVYWWGEGGFFPQMITYVTVPSHCQKRLLHHTWNQHSWNGQVSPRTYAITGWMVESLYYPPVYAEPVYITIGTKMNIEVQGGIGVTIQITNTGVFNATNVSGRILIKGGIFNHIKKTHYYFSDMLKANETLLRTYRPFGFGPVTIEITASTADADGCYFEGKTSIIFIFVYPIIPI